MTISVCITVLNEEKSIDDLLNSLLNQTKKADEIVIVDGGSTDKTVDIIRHYQKKDRRIKLLIEKCSRAKGRNLSCEVAKGDVIAMTDAGCIARNDWLEKLTGPFTNKEIDVSAGFYRMTGRYPVSTAMSVFMGTVPKKFDINFLPSTRSVAFRKAVWEKVGGFPESQKGAAEDTVFNLKLVKNEAKIARVKNAIVEWGMPTSIFNFQFSIFNYAKGDAKSKVWLFPGKGLTSHNIKALFIVLRYLVGVSLLIFCIIHTPLLVYWFIGLLVYFYWSYRKVFSEFGDWRVAIYGPILQIVSDFSVMAGFISGIID